jgi:hypothetical protein
MDATFVELRNKSAAIARALQRRECVNLYYRGKRIGTIRPVGASPANRMRVEDHPAFGMWADREDVRDVDGWLGRIRRRPAKPTPLQ